MTYLITRELVIRRYCGCTGEDCRIQSKMRIGLVSYEYPPQSGFGGVGTYVYRLAGALGRAGHEVVVLAGPTDVPQEWPQPNVTLHRIEAYYNPPRIPGLRFLWWNVIAKYLEKFHRIVWHWLKWNLASGKAIARIHAHTPLDVIEAPEHAANGLYTGWLRRWPLVIRLHGPWDLFFGINRTQGAALNRLLAFLEREQVNDVVLSFNEQFSLDNVDALASALTRVLNRKRGGHDYAPGCRNKIATHSFAMATTGLAAACRALGRSRG